MADVTRDESSVSNSLAGEDQGGFQVVKRRKDSKSPVRQPTLRGKKTITSADSVRAVPRRMTAFVDRLHIDTSEADLRDFLSSAGLSNPMYKKLVPKDSRTFRTAAFMVSTDASRRELFNNESTWPEGCELRDWVFKEKK